MGFPMFKNLKLAAATLLMYVTSVRTLAYDAHVKAKGRHADVANIGSGIALGLTFIGLLVAILFFAAVAPSLSSGLNNTSQAFASFPGVSALINILPILIIVVLFVVVAAYAQKKYHVGK